jgi:hypothetical protein
MFDLKLKKQSIFNKRVLSLNDCLFVNTPSRLRYADDVTIPATGSGTATPVIAADLIAGVYHQRVKLEFGADGAASDVASGNPLPIIGASNSGVDIGDVTINNSTGASAVNIQDGGNSITVDGTEFNYDFRGGPS